MKSLALALLTGALLLAPASLASAAPPPPGGSAAPPSVAELRASMLASDSIQLARVEIEVTPVTDSTGATHDNLKTKRVAINQVKGPWMKRFVANFLPAEKPVSPELCPTPKPTAGSTLPWMVSALWINAHDRGQVYVDFSNDCAFAGLAGRAPVGLAIGANVDSVFALFQQGLFADSVLREMKLGAPSMGTPMSSGGTVAPMPPPAVHQGGTLHQVTPRALGRLPSPPEPIKKVAPVYPEESRAAKEEGRIMVSLVVGVDGKPTEVRAEEGPVALRKAAMRAVMQWRFKPGTIDGQPAPVRLDVPIDFKLDAAPAPGSKPNR